MFFSAKLMKVLWMKFIHVHAINLILMVYGFWFRHSVFENNNIYARIISNIYKHTVLSPKTIYLIYLTNFSLQSNHLYLSTFVSPNYLSRTTSQQVGRSQFEKRFCTKRRGNTAYFRITRMRKILTAKVRVVLRAIVRFKYARRR